MLFTNGARKNWSSAYLLQFALSIFVDHSSYSIWDFSLWENTGGKKSFCLSAVWLLQPQSWQNPLWTKPWGLDTEWIREHIAEYNNWTKGFKSYYKSGDNMACTFEGWSIIKTEWENVPVPSFYELYCRSNQCGLLGWKHTWPCHSRCVHLMALVNTDYISFQLPFGTFDEHLNLLNADDHICCSSEWGD